LEQLSSGASRVIHAAQRDRTLRFFSLSIFLDRTGGHDRYAKRSCALNDDPGLLLFSMLLEVNSV